MYDLKDANYIDTLRFAGNFIIGIVIFFFSILPLLYLPRSFAIFGFVANPLHKLIGDPTGRDTMGWVILCLLLFVSLPVVAGIITYLRSKKHRLIFWGFLFGLLVEIVMKILSIYSH